MVSYICVNKKEVADYHVEVAAKVALILLENEVVKINVENPFKWTSGLLSPIYCDNRVVLSLPEHRNYFRDLFCEIIKERFTESNVIAGVATAGIPMGSIIADRLGLPFVYVRSEAKKHGLGKQIEGRLPSNPRVVVIEDLVSTGSSSFNAVKALQSENSKILAVLANFTYNLPNSENIFTESKIPLITLSNVDALVKILYQKGMNEKEVQLFKEWTQNPEKWGEKFVINAL